MTDVSGSSSSPLYTAMLSAVGTSNATDGYRTAYGDDLAQLLKDELDLETIEEAEAFVDLARISAGGGEASVDDVLLELLEMLDISESDDDADFNDVDIEDLDFSSYIEDAFDEISGDDDVLTEDHASDLAEMLGVTEDQAKELIEYTGGEFGQITKFLYDDDRDGEISIEELYVDGGAIAENIEASKAIIGEFDDFEHGDYNFSMDDEGNVDDDNVANASIDDGKEAMAAFLVEHLGFDQSEAAELIDDLGDDGLLTFDEDNDVIGQQAFVQFKSIVAEYSMKIDDLEDGDNKSDAFKASAENAKESLEEVHGSDWGSPEAVEDMIAQIDSYYNGQMDMFSSMAENVQSAAEMASSLAEGIGDISIPGGEPAPGPAI